MNTVGQLIKELAKHNQDLSVLIEGCDCVGDWNGKLEITSDKELVILRLPEPIETKFHSLPENDPRIISVNY